jgi:hypothetical protein
LRQRTEGRAAFAAAAAEREALRLVEEERHAEAKEAAEEVVVALLEAVAEEALRKAREAVFRGRAKLKNAMSRLRMVEAVRAGREHREILWGLNPGERWRLSKQLLEDGPIHRRHERHKSRMSGLLKTAAETEVATQMQCITRSRQCRARLRRFAKGVADTSQHGSVLLNGVRVATKATAEGSDGEGGGWGQVLGLLNDVGLSRRAEFFARNGVDYTRLLALKPHNLGGGPQELTVRVPTKYGGFKHKQVQLPTWGLSDSSVKRLRFRINSVDGPRLQRAKQLLDFRANISRKKYAELAAEVKLVFAKLSISTGGSEDNPELNKEGFRKLMIRLGIGLNRKQMNETWRWMDRDGDGSVELDEFINWWQKNRNGLSSQSTALERMFQSMFEKGAAIHAEHTPVPFGTDGVWQCSKCKLFGPSGKDECGTVYCSRCIRCSVCCSKETICPESRDASSMRRDRAKVSMRHGDSMYMSHQAYTEFGRETAMAAKSGMFPASETDRGLKRLSKDGHLAAHTISLTEYLGGAIQLAAQGNGVLQAESGGVEQEWGLGAKQRPLLIAHNYIVGTGVDKTIVNNEKWEPWWATAGTPAAEVSSDKISDAELRKYWMGQMGTMRDEAQRLIAEAELQQVRRAPPLGPALCPACKWYRHHGLMRGVSDGGGECGQELQRRTGAGAGAEAHAGMLLVARQMLAQCEEVTNVFGRSSDTYDLITSQSQAMEALGRVEAAAGLIRRGGGLQSPRSMGPADTDETQSRLSMDSLPEGERTSVIDIKTLEDSGEWRSGLYRDGAPAPPPVARKAGALWVNAKELALPALGSFAGVADVAAKKLSKKKRCELCHVQPQMAGGGGLCRGCAKAAGGMRCEACRIQAAEFGRHADGGRLRWCAGCAKAHEGSIELRPAVRSPAQRCAHTASRRALVEASNQKIAQYYTHLARGLTM